ncbi:hypothetical protein GCK32_021160, partial [Trichostrongylus colubriformis]
VKHHSMCSTTCGKVLKERFENDSNWTPLSSLRLFHIARKKIDKVPRRHGPVFNMR